MTPTLHVGVINKRNALLTRPLLYPPFARGETGGSLRVRRGGRGSLSADYSRKHQDS